MIAFDPGPWWAIPPLAKIAPIRCARGFLFFWAFNRIPIHWCGSEVAFQGGVTRTSTDQPILKDQHKASDSDCKPPGLPQRLRVMRR
jgi:hypothetical protein